MRYIVTVNGERLTVELGPDGASVNGRAVSVQMAEVAATPLRILTVGEEVHRVVVRERRGRGHYELWHDGFRYDVEALDERTAAIRELSGAAAVATGPAPIVAPMPGLVVRVSVEPGDAVQAGQGVVVMEAMKMENELRAAAAGTVRAVLVQPGTAVERGAVLVELE